MSYNKRVAVENKISPESLNNWDHKRLGNLGLLVGIVSGFWGRIFGGWFREGEVA
jgi:hypothetical protein